MTQSPPDPFAAQSSRAFDPYDLSECHIQATDGSAGSYWEKRMKFPHYVRHQLERCVALNPNYRSVDDLVRDATYRLIRLLSKETGSVDATELANLWQIEASADIAIETTRSATEAAKKWQQILTSCETQLDLNSKLWELRAMTKGLPPESPHRRRLEEVLVRWIKK